MQTKVAILGAGLSGLYAATLLHRAGIPFTLLEARNRLGGRILTTNGCDLGPSWFWPQAQPHFAALIRELGVATFPQHTEGDILFERMSREAPARYSPAFQEPQSTRIAGGTTALIAALASRVPSENLLPQTRVQQLALENRKVTITVTKSDATRQTLQATHVLAALPPRLLAQLTFSPAIEPATLHRWQQTPTWMAPHAKFFAVYDHPFWRTAGLSGTAQSFVGPLGEIHDATTASGQPALFGFLGIPAAARASLGEPTLTQACVTQLARLFGPEALQPRATHLKDWATDPFTATPDDQTPTGGHPMPTAAPWVTGPWQPHLALCGSETSPTEPGYMAGAVTAANRAVAEVRHHLSHNQSAGNIP